MHYSGEIISTLWQKFTHADFTTRPKSRIFVWGIVSENHAPLRVIKGEAEGVRMEELMEQYCSFGADAGGSDHRGRRRLFRFRIAIVSVPKEGVVTCSDLPK